MYRFAVTAIFLPWIALGASSGSASVLFGAHVGTKQDLHSRSDFVAFEASIGRKLAIDNDPEDWSVFPDSERVEWDAQQGRLPMLSWRIALHENPAKGCATADEIRAGKFDNQLKDQAAAARNLGVPILVRFHYEMNDDRSNECFNGFRVSDNPKVAGEKFVATWKRVVDIFRAAGAENVKWVWAPTHRAYETGLWRTFYPGANYVDWIAVDDYNRTDSPASFFSNNGILSFYEAASRL
ncbi:MAG: hypothetical protein M3Y27_16475, partial [Acidobacteriota bacterium]|nr:hypothetical protein [Acidobacteriota bacterium]